MSTGCVLVRLHSRSTARPAVTSANWRVTGRQGATAQMGLDADPLRLVSSALEIA